jgi:hypothetical protein
MQYNKRGDKEINEIHQLPMNFFSSRKMTFAFEGMANGPREPVHRVDVTAIDTFFFFFFFFVLSSSRDLLSDAIIHVKISMLQYLF